MSNEKKVQVTEVSKPKSCMGIRHLQATMLFLGMVFAYMMRVNLSMAIVAMTDSTNENYFDWSIQTQSIILSSFFWGYAVLQVPAGELSTRFGGSQLITLCVGVNSAVSLLLPIGAHYGGWQLVCGCRVLQGLTQGFLCPSAHTLIGKWIPLEEKRFWGSFIYAGGQLGTALQLIVSGYLAEYWGWPSIFYVTGTLGIIWSTLNIFIGADSPQSSKMITDEEQMYIQSSLGQIGFEKKLSTPWKKIWTSLPFISLIIAHCGQNWGFWTLMTEMPSYYSNVLGVDIKSNGIMSALPYLAMFAMSFPLGYVFDLMLRRNWVSITTSRKLSNSIGFFGPAIALIGLSYSPAGNTMLAVALLTVVVGLNAGQYSGFLLVHIDMAPNFAGSLMGVTNCIANGVSILAPIIAGLILHDETNASEWRLVFYIASAVYIAANLFFIAFGTSEKQEWNEPKDNDQTTVEKSSKIV